eukprot:CAMPEP_0116010846 /NCGR_PEP_ID=MMETSP0321-20121206/4230_1 /TAXON_ID=163516 /ORGANISM="Leptocylindrus danicus var. danicus, Strain B650" /LENGTH=354 /DNA_ID=CAMNT_0003479995 /DNA_START=138 /DNA_END=1203 /DNA_ORIENTATION=+
MTQARPSNQQHLNLTPTIVASNCSATFEVPTLREDYSFENSSLFPDGVIGERIPEIGFSQSIELLSTKPIFPSVQSKYQKIEIFESKHYGKILVLDGVTQLTERDANSYNEMMAHIPMFAHREPKRVLIIGGGDGYVLSEVLKHDSVVQADHVDLDGEVIEVCRKYFKWGEHAWADERTNLIVGDGAAFVRDAPDDYYDVIIQDSSDPFLVSDDGEETPLPSLHKYHFMNIKRILRKGGIFNLQAESYTIPSDLKGIQRWRDQALQLGFTSARYGTIAISTYPTGQIGFLLCESSSASDGEISYNGEADMMQHVKERFDRIKDTGKSTTYYHPRLQISSFDLPYWVEKAIYGDE